MFSQVTNFDIKDNAVDLFYWSDKSSKRIFLLKEHYKFRYTDYSEIIKFVSTLSTCCAWKWLSIVNLKKHKGLKSYSLSALGAGDRFRRLKNAFRDPMLEV